MSSADTTLIYAFRTDTGELISDQPLRNGLYDAKLHLELWLTFNPDVNPLETVLLERVIDEDGDFTDTVHWTNEHRGEQDTEDLSAFADMLTAALERDLITADDFAG